MLEKDRVELYESQTSIFGADVGISVYNVYRLEGEDLDWPYHEAEYRFNDSGNDLYDFLKEFREDCFLFWYGERVIPSIAEIGDQEFMSLHIPASRIHDNSMEKVVATDFAEEVIDELENYLEVVNR